jgi:ribosome biogenesis protein BMS1
VERPPARKFNPLHVPRALAAALPFASKPKQMRARRATPGGDYFVKRAVVMEKGERREHAAMQAVFALAKEKSHQAKLRKREAKVRYEKRRDAEEGERAEKRKEIKKRGFVKEGLEEARKKRKLERGGRGGGGGGGGGDDDLS